MNKDKWLWLEIKGTKGVGRAEKKETHMGESQESMGAREVEHMEEGECGPLMVTDVVGSTKVNDSEERGRGKYVSKTPRKRRFRPTIAARKSSRNNIGMREGQGTSCFMSNPFNVLSNDDDDLEDLLESGNASSVDTSNETSCNFTVINSCGNNILEEIAKKCDIDLGGDRGMVKSNIDAMKMEEVARAALAEVNYRHHINKRFVEQHSLEGENLLLEVVDNSQRGDAQSVETEKQRKKTRGSRLSRELKRISYK